MKTIFAATENGGLTMANEVRLIGCRSCDSKNCGGCNLLTLEEMLHKGDLDCLMDDSRSIVATPESLRPKGRWAAINADCRGYANAFECSNCETISHTHIYMKECDFDFCPVCGAKTEG